MPVLSTSIPAFVWPEVVMSATSADVHARPSAHTERSSSERIQPTHIDGDVRVDGQLIHWAKLHPRRHSRQDGELAVPAVPLGARPAEDRGADRSIV